MACGLLGGAGLSHSVSHSSVDQSVVADYDHHEFDCGLCPLLSGHVIHQSERMSNIFRKSMPALGVEGKLGGQDRKKVRR